MAFLRAGFLALAQFVVAYFLISGAIHSASTAAARWIRIAVPSMLNYSYE